MLKKKHRMIKFNQKAWLEPYIDMNTDLRKAAKSNLEKEIFKLIKKLWKMFRHIEISNLEQQKKEVLNSTHYFTMKISNKPEIQQIPFNHLSDIGF